MKSFQRTLMCGAIASALGFAGAALAADTSSAGGDTGNSPSTAAQAGTSTGTGKSTGAGTSSTGTSGTSSTGSSSTGSTGSTGAGTTGTGSTGGSTTATGTPGGSATGTAGGTSTSTTGTTSGSAMPPERPAAAAATAADSPAKRIFDQLDTNHDGVLSLEEFSRAQFQAPK